jgi:hypothetical protein
MTNALLLAVALACNLGALTPAERAHHAVVTEKLKSAVIARTETPSGYKFALDPKRMTIADLERWAELEGRCCPFFEFTIEPSHDGGPLTLALEGPHGVKEFIDAEFAIGKQTASRRSAAAGAFDERINVVEKEIVGIAETMPSDKYSFVPSAGEFKGVRSFARQLKHLAAANYQLGARILGEDPPNGERGEQAPDSIVTRDQILDYVRGSFAYLRRGAATIHAAPSPSLNFLIDALEHSSNHYGQIVEYLRMNGLVPPAN